MPYIVVLEDTFKKVLMNMDAWATISMGDAGADPVEESTSCGSILRSFKTRRQVYLGAKPSNVVSSSELKDLRNKLEAELKENDSYEAKNHQPQEYCS